MSADHVEPDPRDGGAVPDPSDTPRPAFAGYVSRAGGCRHCGDPVAGRVQLRLTPPAGGSQKLIDSVSASFCEACAVEIFQACESLIRNRSHRALRSLEPELDVGAALREFRGEGAVRA